MRFFSPLRLLSCSLRSLKEKKQVASPIRIFMLVCFQTLRLEARSERGHCRPGFSTRRNPHPLVPSPMKWSPLQARYRHSKLSVQREHRFSSKHRSTCTPETGNLLQFKLFNSGYRDFSFMLPEKTITLQTPSISDTQNKVTDACFDVSFDKKLNLRRRNLWNHLLKSQILSHLRGYA